MQNFEFHNPVKIIFGKGQIAELANQIARDQRILITYGGGSIKNNGVYEQVTKALDGYTLFEFGGIEPNPKYETLMRAVELCRREKIDFILAVGGSVIDGTKFIAAAVNYVGEPWDFVDARIDGMFISFAPGVQNVLPFGTVLTLPAAGSEMNCGAVVSKMNSEDKLAFANPLLFPKFSILDPTVTYTLPQNQTANGIVDAFVHVMEQYLTFPQDALVQDYMAEGLLLALVEEGAKVLKHPDDYAARANVMWSATIALNGWISPGVTHDWSSHMIGHELTAKYGLDHGQTLAIVLPAVMKVRQKQKREKILRYAGRVWGITTGSDEERISQAITKTKEFFVSLGVKTSLSDYQIPVEGVKDILKQLENHKMTALGEHRDIDLAVSAEILRRCWS